MRWDPISAQFKVYEKGGGAPSSTTTVQQNFSPEESAKRAQVMDEATRIYGETADTLATSEFPGAKPVGPSAATTQAQNQLLNYAGGTGQNLVNNTQGYSNFLMGDAQFANSNPYLQSHINAAIRPVTEAYTDAGGVFSGIRNRATGAGQFGSSRQGIAEGIAGRGYLNTIGDISARMSNENYQNAQKNALGALSFAPQTYNLGEQPALATGSVGAQQEGYQQADENYAADSRMWGLNAPWLPLQNYANIVYGGASPGTTTTQTGGLPGYNRTASRLGSAATGASIGSAFGPWGTAAGGIAGYLFGG